MRDELDGETAIEVDNGTMMDLDNDSRARGPDEYAIESLATSLMEANAEATTETFYVGKCERRRRGWIALLQGELCRFKIFPHANFSRDS